MSEITDVSKLKTVRGDILDLPYLISVLKENHVERVIHTAGLLPLGFSANLRYGIRVNFDGTLNVLEASRLTDIKRLVYTSTIGVYAREGSLGEPMDEETTPTKPSSLYGATKLMGEYMGMGYRRTYGLDFRVVRFANVFGPWSGPIQTNTGGLLKELLEGAVKGFEVRVKDPPVMVLDAEWVYSKDAARGIYLLMNKPDPKNTVYNIGSGKTSKIQEIVGYIRELRPDSRIILGDAKAAQSRPLSIKRAKEDLNYEPEYDLRASVKDMIDWYLVRGVS